MSNPNTITVQLTDEEKVKEMSSALDQQLTQIVEWVCSWLDLKAEWVWAEIRFIANNKYRQKGGVD